MKAFRDFNFKIKKMSYYDKKKNNKIMYDKICEYFEVGNEVKVPLQYRIYLKVLLWVDIVRVMRRYRKRE